MPDEPKLVFVVRLKGLVFYRYPALSYQSNLDDSINKIAPKPRKILQLLRLLQLNNGVFVKLTKATAEMLKIVEPYIGYGYPSLKTVRELLYKRGYGKVNKQRVALSSNAIIEENLGKFGLVCMEDLLHEIYTVGPHFKQASNVGDLWVLSGLIIYKH